MLEVPEGIWAPPEVEIALPNEWEPRPLQMGLWLHMQQPTEHLRAVCIWHRRFGKDSTALNLTASKMEDRVGVYWHMLPEYAQGRKAIWNAIDINSRRVIDQAFPRQLRKRTVEDQMMIEWHNGSIWQVVGSDNYNNLVGTNPVGIVFSEYSIAKPAAWDYLRPILRENGGWAIFIYTPRGKNHGKRLADLARRLAAEDPAHWFFQELTVEHTGLQHLAEEERREGMSDEMVDQEYYLSWEGAVPGAYYSKDITKARRDGRICKVPHQPGVPVNTFWDLGLSDNTAVWFHQQVGIQHRWLRAYSNTGEAPAHYMGVLQDYAHQHGYIYGRHYMPHDAEYETLNSVANKDGRNSKELFENLGMRNIEVVARIDDVTVGINLARALLSQCWFDAEGCEQGLDALQQYRKVYDEKQQVFKDKPHHDWSSNYADAFRQWAQGYQPGLVGEFKRKHHRRSHRTV